MPRERFRSAYDALMATLDNDGDLFHLRNLNSGKCYPAVKDIGVSVIDFTLR